MAVHEYVGIVSQLNVRASDVTKMLILMSSDRYDWLLKLGDCENQFLRTSRSVAKGNSLLQKVVINRCLRADVSVKPLMR